MPDYSQGKIYKLVSSQTDKMYIGSTTKSLKERFSEHKSSYQRYNNNECNQYYSSFKLLKYDDCKIELLENYNCDSKEELLFRERYYIENTENSINENSPIKLDEEHIQDKKLYYLYNKEDLLNKRKVYYNLNKNIIQENIKKYRIQNKDKIRKLSNSYNKLKSFCSVCEVEINKSNFSHHEKSNKHQINLQNNLLHLI